jgi:diadenosine tetraphosphatase ApaH/serine/threonine PP2A family protein phosphatase
VRAAIISDVHGNLAALESVYAAIDEEQPGIDEVWCLGDLVGYGPEPEACVARVLDRAAICLAGNHDLVVAGSISMRVFAHDAGAAARWTREVMSEEGLAQLRSLTPFGARNGIELYHASIRDPIWEYVIDDVTAAACLAMQGGRLALIGHSHVPLMYIDDDRRALGGYAEESSAELDERKHLLNPGSVGQPRDGDPRAAFLVLDTTDWTATWRRVDYDIERTQQAILAAGLPASLATRLTDGR